MRHRLSPPPRPLSAGIVPIDGIARSLAVSGAPTNILLGFVHLVLFTAYLVLIFTGRP